jgi:hypothetical protein
MKKRPRTPRQRRLYRSQLQKQREVEEEVAHLKSLVKDHPMGITGAVFLMGSGALGSVLLWPNARDNYFVPRSQWSQTQGVLQSVKKYNGNNKGRKYYGVHPKYSYVIDGQKYSGDRLSFGGAFSTPEEADVTYKKLKSSNHVNVYYNVKHPESSTLSIESDGDSSLCFFFAFIAIVGIALGIFTIKDTARLKKQLAEYHKSTGSHSVINE